jgi:hypothetical protein
MIFGGILHAVAAPAAFHYLAQVRGRITTTIIIIIIIINHHPSSLSSSLVSPVAASPS